MTTAGAAFGDQVINSSVNQMDQMTQKNAAMVEELTAAGRGLTEESDRLSKLTTQFRVGHADKRAAPKVVAANTSLARPKPSKAVIQRPALRLAQGNGTSAVLRKPPVEANGEWQEF